MLKSTILFALGVYLLTAVISLLVACMVRALYLITFKQRGRHGKS